MSNQLPLRIATLFVVSSLIACGSSHGTSRAVAERRTIAKAEAADRIERAADMSALPEVRQRILKEAIRWLGTPYKFGGSSRSGIDCSGFVQNVYRTVDAKLPRNSAQQSSVGTTVDIEHAMPGDLVFFNTSGRGVSHVGIVVDRDAFVHASTSDGVTVSLLSQPYYHSRIVSIQRVIDVTTTE
jgi:cell wall-associated NlpC family hydrolase